MEARIEFVRLEPERNYDIAGLRVRAKRQHHGGDSYGYRIEQRGKVVVYSTDSEHKQDDPEEVAAFVEFFRDADLVIFDAQYSLADAISVKEDWGHSSNVVGVEMCQLARARRLCLYHHEPIFDDERIARLLAETRRLEEITRTDHRVEVWPPTTAWRSRSEETGLSVDPPDRRHGADPSHWAERRWARAFLGGRGRPAGALLLAALLLGLLLPQLPGLRLLRASAFDTYQSLHPRVPRMAPVVIVAIDEESLRQYGQWPWPRTWLARIVGVVAAARPAAIGLAILMPEPDRLSPARLPEMVAGMDADMAQRLSRLRGNDAVLAEAIRGQPVVLGIAGLEGRPPEATTEIRHAPVRSIGGDPAPFLRRFEAALHSVDEIDRAAVGHGLTSVDLERGVVRRVPLLARVAERLVPSLGLEMLRVGEGGPPISVRVSAAGIQTVGVGAFVAPSDPDGSAWIHYTRHDPDRFVSAADVLAGQADASLFQGRLVLIGVTALGLSDHLATPVGDHMSGVEVHAQFLENLVEGSLLSRPRFVRWIEIGWLLAGGLLLIVLVPRLSARASVGLLAALVAAMAGARAAALSEDGRPPGRRHPLRGARHPVRHDARGHPHRDPDAASRSAPTGGAAAGGGGAAGRRAGGRAPDPDGHPAARGGRLSGRERASICTRCWSPRARSAATCTTSSSWMPIISSS